MLHTALPSSLTLLQRHLKRHQVLEHISEAKYIRVNVLKKQFKSSNREQATQLWIAAYMEVFDIDERDRNKVPSPCTRQEFMSHRA